MVDDVLVAALKRELAGYIAEGKEDRANQVRAELKRVTKESAATGPIETATAKPAETRLKASRSAKASAKKKG